MQETGAANDSDALADGLYDQEFLDMIVKSEKDLSEIDDERGELNARKAEIVARMTAKGLNKEAVKAAFKYFRTPEEKRERFDLSYQITRKALGMPVQDDLFVAAAQRQVDRHQESKH